MAKKFLTGLNLVVLDVDPATGSEGELYFNSSASVAKIYQAGAWSVLGAGAGGGTTVSTTEPESPEIGDSWYKNDTGEFYVYDGTYWVEVNGVVASNSFTTISVSGEDNVVADSNGDTLTLIAGTNVTIETNATNDSITINADSKSTSSVYLVRNNTGSTILKGTLVSASGAEPSGRIDVEPFAAVGGINSELTVMGMATANISNGVNGEVISFGTLTGLDTRGNVASSIAVGDETWAEGDILFAHPTVAGKLTKVRPQHDLAVAFITVRHASTGQIAVRIVPGNNHLEWMHDVLISGSVQNSEVLAYDLSNGVWANKTASEAGIATTSDLSNYLTTSSASINYATKTYADNAASSASAAAVSYLVDSAPGTLDTLNELAAALNDDANFSSTVTTALGNKLNISTASSIYLTQVNASTTYATTSHNHTLDSLSNVDINSLTDGDAIIWSSASSAWINQVASGGATTNVSETPPESAEIGDSWYKQSTGSFFIYDGTYWVEVTSMITMTDEQAQDKVSSLFVHSNHSNLTATYDDENNQILLQAISDVNSISGTGNEINVSASVGNITIGLPNDVTISNDLTVLGNLLVSGSTTTLNTTELLVEDNIITLNSGVSGSPSINAGIEVERGVLNNVSIRWNESLGVWEYTNDGTIYNELGSGSGALYQDEAPEDAEIGTIWVDSNASAAIINTNDFVLKSEVEAYVPHTFLLMGG